MENANPILFHVWYISIIPILLVALYGFFKCGMNRAETAIVSIVAFIPVINTLVLLMFCFFGATDGPKRNGLNQH